MINGQTLNNALTRANKQEIIDWTAFDYSAKVEANYPYTAPSDGLYIAYTTKTGYDQITIDNLNPGLLFKDNTSSFARVRKGQICSVVGNITATCVFVPLKGV